MSEEMPPVDTEENEGINEGENEGDIGTEEE